MAPAAGATLLFGRALCTAPGAVRPASGKETPCRQVEIGTPRTRVLERKETLTGSRKARLPGMIGRENAKTHCFARQPQVRPGHQPAPHPPVDGHGRGKPAPVLPAASPACHRLDDDLARTGQQIRGRAGKKAEGATPGIEVRRCDLADHPRGADIEGQLRAALRRCAPCPGQERMCLRSRLVPPWPTCLTTASGAPGRPVGW